MRISLHKSHVLLYVVGAFALGVLIGSFVITSNLPLLISALVGTLILSISSYRKTFPSTEEGAYKRKLGFLIGCLILVATCGLWRSNVFRMDHGRLQEFTDVILKNGKPVPVTLEGYVDGPINQGANSISFPVQVRDLVAGRFNWPIQERILVYVDSRPDYKYGDILQLDGVLQSPKNFSDFDYIAYLQQQGIHQIMRSPKLLLINKPKLKLSLWEKITIPLYRNLFSIRGHLEQATSNSISNPAASYINGILFGSKSEISDQLKSDFAKTGTSHILAISGYNITIIAEVVMFLLLFAVSRKPAFWISTLIIILFTLLTGASASVVRAAIMGLLLLFASGYGRLYDARHIVVIAAGLMILLNPMLLRFDVGFQLSFLAVLGLLFVNPLFSSRFARLPIPENLRDIIFTTLSAQVLVLPLAIFYFHQLSLVFLIVNALVLPLVPLAMLLGFLTSLGGILWLPLGKTFGLFAHLVAWYQLWVIQGFARMPFATLTISIHWITMLVIYLLIAYWLVKTWNRKPVATE